MSDRGGDGPQTSRGGLLLPRDLFGRIACSCAGLFFGVCGVAGLVGLLVSRVGISGLDFYELSTFAAVFGTALLLWGLAMPRWVETLVNRVVIHATMVFGLLFLPFAIEFLVLIARGNL